MSEFLKIRQPVMVGVIVGTGGAGCRHVGETTEVQHLKPIRHAVAIVVGVFRKDRHCVVREILLPLSSDIRTPADHRIVFPPSPLGDNLWSYQLQNVRHPAAHNPFGMRGNCPDMKRELSERHSGRRLVFAVSVYTDPCRRRKKRHDFQYVIPRNRPSRKRLRLRCVERTPIDGVYRFVHDPRANARLPPARIVSVDIHQCVAGCCPWSEMRSLAIVVPCHELQQRRLVRDGRLPVFPECRQSRPDHHRRKLVLVLRPYRLTPVRTCLLDGGNETFLETPGCVFTQERANAVKCASRPGA